MADRIQLRRDTAANWTNYNPILLEGEPGIELDTDQWKMGDGVHNWADLPYRGGECVQQRGQSTTVAMSQKAVTDELNLIGVFDISAYNLTDGQPTKYADLTAALGTNGANVPTQYRVPGMTVRYVQSSDNKYVQFRYMSSSTANADFTNVANWQGVDDEPTAGSNNLVESGGVARLIGGDIIVAVKVERGTINGAGEIASATNRLRTSDFINSSKINVNPGNGKVSVFAYSNSSFISYYEWTTETRDYEVEGATKYKIVFAFTDNSDILVSDYDSLGIEIKGFSAGDISFSTGEKVRNVGIDSTPVKNGSNLIKSGAVYNVKTEVYQNRELFGNGVLSVFDIVEGKAISSEGQIEDNADYSYVDYIDVIDGIYILEVNKTYIAGFTRVHGYKNGIWVKQINYLPSTVIGLNNIEFDIQQEEIDAVRISYRNDSTTLVKLQQIKNKYQHQLDVNIEKGSYVDGDNRYGLFSDDNTLISYINKKPIVIFDSKYIIIHKGKIEDRTARLFFRDDNGGNISTVEIYNVNENIREPIPTMTKYIDIEVSAHKNYGFGDASTITGKAISSEGQIEDNADYSYVDSVDVGSGNYKLTIYKSDIAGFTRIHGYKNGVWVKQVAVITSGYVGSQSVLFDINVDEVDSLCISYRHQSTDLTGLSVLSELTGDTILADFYGGIEIPREEKRIYINSNSAILNPFNVGGPDELLSCMCYMLPPNYSYNGKKVPLIVWFDGSAGYPSLTSSFQNNKLPGLQYMRDEGFAVMQVFAWGAEYAISCPGCGSDMPYPTRTCLRTIRSAIEFMVDRYNIDAENVHVVSKSFGGIISSYFTMFPIWNFKSIGMFSPCIDVLSMRGRFLGGRLALIQDLNLQGDYVEDFKDISLNGDTQTGVENYFFSPRCQNLWLENFTKLMSINAAWIRLCEAGYNEKYAESLANARAWWNTGGSSEPYKYNADVYTNTDRHRVGKVPCKLWIATHDVDTPHQIMIEFVEQLKNCGCYAEATVLEGGHHSSPDFDYTESVTTKLGIYYESVAIGWRENIEWIRRNSVGSIE